MTEHEESLHFLDYWRIIRSRYEIVIAVSLLVVFTGIFVTYAMPRVYKAAAVIQVREETPDISISKNEGPRVIYDPLFLRTQYEIIQSRPIIEEAVRQQGLNDKLGKAYGYLDTLSITASFDQTVKLVSRSMKVRQYRDTNLIAIEIYLSEPKDTVPQEAADLANRIATIYRDTTMQKSRDELDAALKAIKDSLDQQEKNVQELQARVEEIRQKYKITYVGQYGAESSALGKLSLREMDVERIKASGELVSKKAKYDKVMSLSQNELLDAAPRLVNDPALDSLVQKKREAEVELSSLLSKGALGPNHPDVIRAKATIKELDLKIGEALKGLKTGVQADYEAAKAQFDAMEKIMGDEKADDIRSEASGYSEFDKAVEELQDTKKLRDAIKLRYREQEIELRIPRTTVKVWEPAKAPDKNDPVSPNILLNLIASIVMGLVTSVALAYFIEYLDTSVKTIEDVERYMHVPVLGVIPQKMKPFVEDSGKGAHIEAYRVLRTNIHFSKKPKEVKTLCVTSGSVGEGKSLTLFNLAYVCAQLGDKILVVDSDLHRPRQHKIFGVSNAVGLANVLIGEVSIENPIIQTKLPNLDFLSSGKLASGGVHGLLGTQKMADILDILKKNYDFIFFDAPPIIGVSDASLLVGRMDGVLLVVQHRKYPRSVSNRAKDMVQNVGANLIGVVLNNINITRDYSYYYHYYSYPQQPTPRSGISARRAGKPA